MTEYEIEQKTSSLANSSKAEGDDIRISRYYHELSRRRELSRTKPQRSLYKPYRQTAPGLFSFSWTSSRSFGNQHRCVFGLVDKIAGGIAVFAVQPEVPSVGDGCLASQDVSCSPEDGMVHRMSRDQGKAALS